jgi:outer membrane protein
MLPKRFRPSLAALSAGMALGLPLAAQAQSLQELYDAAHGYDATYLAARSLADSATYRAAQAEALNRPTLAGSASTNNAQNDYPRLGSSDIASRQVSLNGRYPLFNRANSATIEQARRSLETARADLDTAEQDLIVRVAQAYFDVLAAQDTLGTTRANKTAITETLASAKRNFEVGTATITDTREAQARFDLATAQEIAADNDLRTKRIALDQLVGRTGVAPRPLLVPVLLPDTVPANADEWVNVADAQHPSVLRARVGLDVAKLETAKAKAAALPTLDAVGALGMSYSRGITIAIPGTTKSASLGLQMNLPLYTGGATQNRIEETLALEEKSRNDLEAARRGVAQGTRVAYFGVHSGVAQVKALEAAEASSKLALEATQLGYKVGVRVNLDVLNAQTQLFQTQRDLAKARYDVMVGGLRLRQASGRLTPDDVAATNRLLQP